MKILQKKVTTYLTIAVFALLIAGGLYYFMQEEDAVPAPSAADEEETLPANMTFSGSSLIEQQNGKKIWEITAGTITIEPKTKNVLLSDMKAVFYEDDGGRTVEMLAPSAVIDGKTRDIVMTGGSFAHTSNGAQFKAQQVRYGADDHQLFGSGSIELVRDDTCLTGDELEGDTELIKVKVKGNARIVKGGASQ